MHALSHQCPDIISFHIANLYGYNLEILQFYFKCLNPLQVSSHYAVQ